MDEQNDLNYNTSLLNFSFPRLISYQETQSMFKEIILRYPQPIFISADFKESLTFYNNPHLVNPLSIHDITNSTKMYYLEAMVKRPEEATGIIMRFYEPEKYDAKKEDRPLFERVKMNSYFQRENDYLIDMEKELVINVRRGIQSYFERFKDDR
ncbi:MAG: hypothetical protein WC867_03645 [Candidatus Pacearchaeota archaeon]|jgi:hypothetical protein